MLVLLKSNLRFGLQAPALSPEAYKKSQTFSHHSLKVCNQSGLMSGPSLAICDLPMTKL